MKTAKKMSGGGRGRGPNKPKGGKVTKAKTKKEEDETEYAVERVVGKELKPNNEVQYLIDWSGRDPETGKRYEMTWETLDNCKNTETAIAEFNAHFTKYDTDKLNRQEEALIKHYSDTYRARNPRKPPTRFIVQYVLPGIEYPPLDKTWGVVYYALREKANRNFELIWSYGPETNPIMGPTTVLRIFPETY